MTIRIGEVVAVHGVKITLRIDDDSSKEVLFYDGERFKGVSIREYVLIQRGFRDLVCIVEGEHLDESRIDSSNGKSVYIRRVDVRPIGYFDGESFQHGIKYLPMIRDPAFLASERRVTAIFDRGLITDDFTIGRMLKEDIPISLPWKRLFNGHIGIFGNTGSGKSNTLAKLYTVLFDRKLAIVAQKSRFVVLDFNGEYVGDQFTAADQKAIYRLSTRGGQPGLSGDRFPLRADEFWELETLSLLFQATTNTQRPFLNRLIEGRKRYLNAPNALTNFAKTSFRRAFCAGSPKSATLDLMRTVARELNNEPLIAYLKEVSWHSTQQKFFIPGQNIWFEADGSSYDHHVGPLVDQFDAANLDHFAQLTLRVHLQLIRDLVSGYVQFEHIQPLLKRVEASLIQLRCVLDVGEDSATQRPLTIVSFRRCSNEIKKVLPLLLAKQYYNGHKDAVGTPPDRTVHLIIDEAHNILSDQSSRESENWKDYRLELFEEIVKEGRKFGVFVTVSSQRPADISPTIVSQLHNFFIHRLINDRDLALVDNTITTLDAVSRGLIPGLAQGCCVVTGTAFDIPMVLQVDRLEKAKQPNSDDVDLEALWAGTA
mgnify:CR=1 FL=1